MTGKQILQISPERGTILIEEIRAAKRSAFVLEVFDRLIIEFLNDISKEIVRNRRLNTVPATAALGFWLRRSHIESIIRDNAHIKSSQKVQASPAGIVFHVCPSNVDTMFLYSLAISLLAANRNILRISQRFSDPLIDMIFDLINSTLARDEYGVLRDYISIVSYGHDSDINAHFSMLADVRIIWGGDATVSAFKALKTGPRTRDIAFADRISCSLFKTSVFNASSPEVQKEAARKFFNDSYTFDQLGCSSPQSIFTLGDENENEIFEKNFYHLLDEIARESYNNDIASIASMKLNKLVEDAITNTNLKAAELDSNYLYFVDVNDANNTLSHSCGAGYFYIQQIKDIFEILPLVSKKMQTLCYFGLEKEEINNLSKMSNGIGIDRIVPVGHSLDFEYIWDGFNLFDELTSKKWVI